MPAVVAGPDTTTSYASRRLYRRHRRRLFRRQHDATFSCLVCQVGTTMLLLAGVVLLLTSYQMVWMRSEWRTIMHTQQPTYDLVVDEHDAFGLARRQQQQQQQLRTNVDDMDGLFWQRARRLRNEIVKWHDDNEIQVRRQLHASVTARWGQPATTMSSSSWSRNITILVLGGAAVTGQSNDAATQAYASLLPSILAASSFHVQVLNRAVPASRPLPALLCHWQHNVHVLVLDFVRWTMAEIAATLEYVATQASPDCTLIVRGILPTQLPPFQEMYGHRLHVIVLNENMGTTGGVVHDALFYGESHHRVGAHDLSVSQHAWMAHVLALELLRTWEQQALLSLSPAMMVVDQQQLQAPPRPNLPVTDVLLHGAWQCHSSYEFELRNATSLLDDTTTTTTNGKLSQLVLTDDDTPTNTMTVADLLLPTSAQSFHTARSWRRDLTKRDKREKHRTWPVAFAHRRDWKMAYFGLATSPTLRVRLPSTVQRVMVCAVDDEIVLERTWRGNVDDYHDFCVLSRDASFTWHGQRHGNTTTTTTTTTDVIVPARTVHPIAWATPNCVQVAVPTTTIITTTTTDAAATAAAAAAQLVLHIQVTNVRRTYKSPCSVAHVLWQ